MDASILWGTVTGLLSVLWMLCTWIIFEIKNKLEKTSQDFADYRVHVAREYVSKQEMKDVVESLNRAVESYSARIDRRFDNLEEKFEKMRE